MPTLGSTLAKTLPQLTDLILKETDRTRRTELRAVHRKLSSQLRRLVDKNVDRDTREYAKATTALEAANAAIKDAKRDLAKVAQTIDKLAKAADLIGKVAAMAA